MKSGVYLITNIANGKVYVGSAVNIAYRWKKHLRLLAKAKHHSIKLQNAWNAYGQLNFVHSTLELVEVDRLIEREQFWLDHYDAANAGYNILSCAYSSLGSRHTEQSRKKIGAHHKGKTISAEHRAAISAANKGKAISEQAKINRANSWTPERRKRRSEISASIILDASARKKISMSSRGRTLSAESRAKISAARIGVKASDKAKENMRAAHANRPQISEETRQKMAEARKTYWRERAKTNWYTNGTINVMREECPDGFYSGRNIKGNV